MSVDGNDVTTNQDFDNLSSQLAKVSATGVQMSAYNPTNSPASCPSVGETWAAKATPLPPMPNEQLCNCMYNTLSCVVKGNTDSDNYGELFGQICGYNDGAYCAGILNNATTGNYGAYSMCNSTEQLGFVMNQYYQAQSGSNQASACNFGGAGSTKATQAAGPTCSSLLREAGAAGTNTVTSQPSGTGGAGSGSSGSGSGSDSDSDSGSSNSDSSSGSAGIMNAVPSSELSILPAVFMVILAAVSGMGMILL